MKIEAWGVSGACFWSLGCCWRVLWMLGVDFDGFRVHFGLHFESNFGPEMCYFSSYFLIGCWMWFWAVFDQFPGRFWCALEQKCGLPWNMWDCEKPMFYVVNSMISRVRGLFFDPKSVEKHTWNPKWVLKLFFCWFCDILRSFWDPFWQQKSIQNLYEFWKDLGSCFRRQMELHLQTTVEKSRIRGCRERVGWG